MDEISDPIMRLADALDNFGKATEQTPAEGVDAGQAPTRRWPLPPDQPTTSQYYGDGKTYDRGLGRVSPEGNIYGETRRLRELERLFWWDGSDWIEIDSDLGTIQGQITDGSELPAGPRDFGAIWRQLVTDPNTGKQIWKYSYWDSESGEWKPLRLLFDVSKESDLPTPGYFVGATHVVVELDVEVMWDGKSPGSDKGHWVRSHAHSGIRNDQPEFHLPPGFLQLLSPTVKLVFVGRNEIAVRGVSGSKSIAVGTEVLTAPGSSVFSNLPCLAWDDNAQTITADYLEQDVNYWIYWANNRSAAFSVEALPGDAWSNATPAWDFRGKLLLSTTAPTNGYLGTQGAGINAKLAGKCHTDLTLKTDGGPFFLHQLDISLIDQGPSLPDAFREYSDFVLTFVDEDTLKLEKLYGTRGQLYIPDGLVYLGEGFEIGGDDGWISILTVTSDDQVPQYNDTALAGNAIYYCYIAGNLDGFNFNAVNADTGRPWQATDQGASGHYDAALDFRFRPFLSDQVPDQGRIAGTEPGFYTRLLGQIRTDANGRFLNSSDISTIRQPTLNPSYLDGLAEVTLQIASTTQLKLAKARGTSGVVLVSGQAVQTYEATDERVHVLNNSDTVWTYDEDEITAPLETTGHAVSYYAGETLYLYLADDEGCWGSLAGKLFASTDVPVNGYLSSNYPGNNARWVATVVPDINGEFTGGCIVESIGTAGLLIADSEVSTDKLWSSQQVQNELNKLWAALSASSLFEQQKLTGISLILEMVDTGNLRLRSIYSESTIAFGDLTTRTIDSTGISLALTGVAGSHLYAYLEHDNFYLSATAPGMDWTRLETKGASNEAILVGEVYLTGTNSITGSWNVCSSHNEPTRQWTTAATTVNTVLCPGLAVTRRCSGTVARTGASTFRLTWRIQPYIGGATGPWFYYNAIVSGALGELQSAVVLAWSNWTDGNQHYCTWHCSHQLTATFALSRTVLGVGVYTDIMFSLTGPTDSHVYHWASEYPAGVNEEVTFLGLDSSTGDIVITRGTS